MKIIKDIRFDEKERYKTKCIKCGKEISFRWNNGELDWNTCCGLEYELNIARIDLYIFPEEK